MKVLALHCISFFVYIWTRPPQRRRRCSAEFEKQRNKFILLSRLFSPRMPKRYIVDANGMQPTNFMRYVFSADNAFTLAEYLRPVWVIVYFLCYLTVLPLIYDVLPTSVFGSYTCCGNLKLLSCHFTNGQFYFTR